MDIARSQLGAQTVAITGKAKKGMEAVLAKMTVVGHTLLLTVYRVLGGIHIDGQAPLVLPSQQGIRGPGQGGLQGL